MYISTTKSTPLYHIEKNKCGGTVFGEGCYDQHCIINKHTWWAVNEIQGEFGEIQFEGQYADCINYAKNRYGV
jgi:CO dehydrogenase/acetyl-CoA synthase alpha subunit